MTQRIRGYYYQIIEQLPCQFMTGESGDTFHNIIIRDTLEGAQQFLEVIENTEHDFSVYKILLTPIWEKLDDTPRET